MSNHKIEVYTRSRGIAFTRKVQRILKPKGFSYRGFLHWTKPGTIVKASRIDGGYEFSSESWTVLQSLTVLDESLTYNDLSMPPDNSGANWPNT